MRKLYSIFIALALLLTGLILPQRIRAQEQGPDRPPIQFTNCFPTASHARPSGPGQLAGPQSRSSTYGGALTPQGTLKVLVIFAGLTNDVDGQAPFYLPGANNPWPQTDATHLVPGTTFPKNPARDFYDNLNSFQPTATDNSLSNLYYQMSQHSANPFKIQAVVFPKRINVTATQAGVKGQFVHVSNGSQNRSSIKIATDVTQRMAAQGSAGRHPRGLPAFSAGCPLVGQRVKS